MAGQPCWRCLQRLTISSPSPRITTFQRAAFPTFSTSAHLNKTPLNNPASKKGGARDGQRTRKTLRIGKKKVTRSKPPAPGERKAARMRIVLSNTNAFEVEGLRDLNKTNYADPSLEGTMVGLPGPVVDQLRAIEAFQTTQGWGFFKRPATLARKETMEIARHISECSEAENPQTMRRLFVGERGSGKSILLLQAQAIAFQAGWVVVHIPAAFLLINANSAYAPLPDTNPIKYVQPTLTAALLSRIAAANQAVLSRLKLTQEHDLPVPVQPDMSLFQFAELGAEDPSMAWQVFTALWSELTTAKQRRPPILYSLEGIAHISRPSDYLKPNMRNVNSHDLSLVDHYAAHLSGEVSLPNGGAVLAADSAANRPTAPSLDSAIRQSEAETPAGASKLPLFDPVNPFVKQDNVVLDRWRRVGVTRVPRLSKAEAKTVLEYFARSGMLRGTVTEALVAEKWTVSGEGLFAQLEKVALKSGI